MEMDEVGEEETCDGGMHGGADRDCFPGGSGDSRLIYCLRYAYPRYWAMKRSLMIQSVRLVLILLEFS